MKSKVDKNVSLIEAYKSVFSTEQGKKVLMDLMMKGSMLDTTFSSELNKVLFAEGRRSLVLYILSNIDTDPLALREYMTNIINDERIDSLQ